MTKKKEDEAPKEDPEMKITHGVFAGLTLAQARVKLEAQAKGKKKSDKDDEDGG